jgi:hypothetical protein
MIGTRKLHEFASSILVSIPSIIGRQALKLDSLDGWQSLLSRQ